MKAIYTGRQAILTRYHGPTNTKGARISARCGAGKIFVSYDYALDAVENHAGAAEALVIKMGWAPAIGFGEKLVGGGLPTSDFAWVFIDRFSSARD